MASCKSVSETACGSGTYKLLSIMFGKYFYISGAGRFVNSFLEGEFVVKRIYMRTRSLKEGMKIDQSIVDRMGRVLIARGAALDEYLIESLLKRGITSVYIREGEEEPEEVKISLLAQSVIEKVRVDDRSKVQLKESVKKRVAEGMQYLYNNTDTQDFTDATNTIADELQHAISSNDAIAVDIGALKVSDEYTFKHSVDVATMAMIVAKQYGFDKKQVYEIGISGLLHDLGKSKIPNEVLNKPARLTEEEFEVMKQHSVFGYRILKDKKDISDQVRLGVLQHHEKVNGTGYPMGVTAAQMHVYAKILSVVDIYDALVTERPYKNAFSQRDAVEMIMSMTQELDMDVMKSFLESMILYPVDSIVQLSNGEQAKVVENNSGYILRPKVVGVESGKIYDLGRDMRCNNIIIL